jgi:type IV pilus assembly protein PilX
MIRQQKGSVLLITLIVLALLLIAGLTLFSSTQITTQVAGNVAFKQIALPAANVAIEQAITKLNTQADLNNDIAGNYFALQQQNDSDGLPSSVNWSQVPSTQVQNYTVQYVTERLCVGHIPIIDLNSQCSVGNANINSSYKVNSPVYAAGSIYYRVTVKVSGPKNTLTFVQAILER